MSVECKRVRFTADDDLALLREVTARNPLKEPEAWVNVQANIERTVGKHFSIRTLKDHLQLLVEMWLRKDGIYRKKSGTEEVYSEKDQLLQEISDLCNEPDCSIKKKRKPAIRKEEQIILLGKQARNEQAIVFLEEKDNLSLEEFQTPSTSTFTGVEQIEVINIEVEEDNIAQEAVNTSNERADNTIVGISDVVPTENICKDSKQVPAAATKRILLPNRKRNNRSKPLRQNAFQYLTEKNEKERQFKLKDQVLEERRLQLEERRVSLDEKRFELEMEERRERIAIEKSRLEMESNKINQLHNLIQKQQIIIETLITANNNKNK